MRVLCRPWGLIVGYIFSLPSNFSAQPAFGFSLFVSLGGTRISRAKQRVTRPMSGSSGCTVYIGNLDEKVSDRVLYDILIQAGRVVDLHIPRDKETDKPKGYAFAEYESEEIADYAVKLFSGLVTLCNRTLKFAISGQDKASLPNGHMSAPSLAHKLRSSPMPINNVDTSYHSMTMSTTSWISNISSNYSQVPLPPGVSHYSNGYGSPFNGINYDIGRRDFGSPFDSTNHSRLHSYDTSYFMP